MSASAAAAALDSLGFDALGDPMRRQLVELLRSGPTAVGRIADALPIGRPAVSKHLKVLVTAGLVDYRRVGTRHLYALAPDGLAPLQQWLTRQWDATLAAFAAYVDTTAGPPAAAADGDLLRAGPEQPGQREPEESS